MPITAPDSPPDDQPVRLQKFLATAGLCSRRKAEQHIQAGDVCVNGAPVRTMGTKVIPGRDDIVFQGKPVTADNNRVYIMVYKPRGVISSCHHRGRKIVLDLVDCAERLYPVGRLDKDSTGLLLLTNDGALHHRLLHPSFDHEKVYAVTVAAPIPDHVLQKLASGVFLNGRKTRPAEIRRTGERRFTMVLREGRNRQIRRMLQTVGWQVVALKRVAFCGLRLGLLRPGQWRHLNAAERRKLRETGTGKTRSA